jgi:DNA-binding CsgD family transcriptional regulator
VTPDPVARRLMSAVDEGDWTAVLDSLRSSYTHLVQTEPAILLRALERMPPEVMDRAPRLRIAMAHLGRTLHGDGWVDPAPGRRSLPVPLAPADQLSIWAARGSVARGQGRMEDAFRLMEDARALLGRLSPLEEASLSAALPEILQEWALTCEQDSRLAEALALHASAHEWATVIGHRTMAASSAGSAALLQAVAGRNTAAGDWLLRVPDLDGTAQQAGSTVAAVLAEAVLRADRLDTDGAVLLLDGLDGTSLGERGPAVDFVRALVARGRPLLSDSIVRGVRASLAVTGPRPGRGHPEILDAVEAFADAPGQQVPHDRPISLMARIATATRALAAHLQGDEATARRLAGPLLDSAESPHVLISALLAVSSPPTRGLEEAAALAHAHASFGVLGLLPADQRRRVADELTVHGDHDVARRLRARDRPAAPELTPARRRIAYAAARGASAPEIAEENGVSVNTVKTQLRAVYRQLGVRSRAELAAALDGATGTRPGDAAPER